MQKFCANCVINISTSFNYNQNYRTSIVCWVYVDLLDLLEQNGSWLMCDRQDEAETTIRRSERRLWVTNCSCLQQLRTNVFGHLHTTLVQK